jgi:asparagine synthase (glutamine-hydrolysing)
MADVPLGVFLSGGIDSAAITALTARMVDGPVKSFSVAFAEREANEFQWARLVAERYRTEHHEVTLTPEEFFESVPSMVWHEDEPMAHPSSVALHHVAKLASRHVKVVLTGEGSDETLAGYNRYRVTIYNRRLGAGYEAVMPSFLRKSVREALAAAPKGSRTARRLRRTFLGLPADLESIYCDNFAVFDRKALQGILHPDVRRALGDYDPYASYHAASHARRSSSLLDQLLYADTKTYLHELLMKQDQMSMAASIESRVPFLDHKLVEWVTTLPDRLKLRGTTTKYVLRRAMKDLLPAEILDRKKMGFPVPVGAWLRGPYRGMLERVLLHERSLSRGVLVPDEVRRLVTRHVGGELGLDERLWALLNFELWHRMFIDGEPVSDVTRELMGASHATAAA